MSWRRRERFEPRPRVQRLAVPLAFVSDEDPPRLRPRGLAGSARDERKLGIG